MNNPIAANVLGTTGAICWSIQLIPQIIINYRKHDTTGLQPTMMLLWASAGLPLGVYNIASNFNIALRIQPQILTLLSLITWAQCKYYNNDTDHNSDHGNIDRNDSVHNNTDHDNNRNNSTKTWSAKKCILTTTTIAITLALIEYALTIGVRTAQTQHHQTWPAKLMAILAALLLCAGVLRHYYDIYTNHTVRGISFLFVGIDALGDVTSFVSVFFQDGKIDVLGLCVYGSEFLLWVGVFGAGGWFNFRPWVSRKIENRRGGVGGTDVVGDMMDESGDGGSVVDAAQVGGDGHAENEQQQQQNGGGGSRTVTDRPNVERRSSSASSVFRTASSRLSERGSIHGDGIRLRTRIVDQV